MISDRWAEKYISHDGIYLLNHSVGLPLRSLEPTATTDFWQAWRNADSEIWTHWLAAIESFRARLASLLNGEKDSFCPQTSLSSAVAKILDSLPLDKERNCILMSEEDFPSIAFALQKAGGAGYRLKFIPAEADTSDIDIWDQQTTSDVAMVLVDRKSVV